MEINLNKKLCRIILTLTTNIKPSFHTTGIINCTNSITRSSAHFHFLYFHLLRLAIESENNKNHSKNQISTLCYAD